MDLCQRKKAEITSYMVEKISSYETIKGLHLASKVSFNLGQEYLPYLREKSRLETAINVEDNIKNWFQNIGIVVLLFFGSFLVLKGKMTIGSVLTFYSLLLLILEPIKNLLSFDYQYFEAKNALKRSGYFEDVQIIEKRVDKDQIDLEIAVKETSTGSIVGGIGYGSSDGLLLNAGVSDSNVFGSGYKGSIMVDKSDDTLSGNINLTNPRVNDSA